MRDYAHRYSAVGQKKQRVSARKTSGPGNQTAWKAVGVVAVLALVCSLVMSLAFGMAIRSSLAELSGIRKENGRLTSQEKKLSEQWSALMDEKTMLKAAGEIGLFPPRPEQIRHP